MDTASLAESFRDLLLRFRGRTGLTQRELAERVGVHRRSVQEWEVGLTYPSAERLEALIRVLLEGHGLRAGQEAAEAQALWAAVEREARRVHAPFDRAWFTQLLAEHATPSAPPRPTPASVPPAEPAGLIGSVGPDEAAARRQDWGEAPDGTGFVGRIEELRTLRRWVLEERCRLLAILGLGGIGKTTLAARLAQEVAPSFERVYWRSLRDAPSPSDWLAGAISFLSDQHLASPPAEAERRTTLVQLLRQRRCLLVLENFRAVLEPGQAEGSYGIGLEGYGRLLLAVGEAAHQSCLIVTSREAPPELAVLSGDDMVRTLHLGGLAADEVQVLLASKHLDGTGEQWAELTARFGGNGLALKIIGETIRELFGGDIGSFLAEAGAGGIFGGIRWLLAEQIERASALEQQVLRVLAVEREPLALAPLLAAVGPRGGRGAVLQAVEALRRRSLAERIEVVGGVAFTLQSVVLEYVTDRLVEAVAEEIEDGRPMLLVEQPLVKAEAKDYVRQTQERLIGEPILRRLAGAGGDAGAEQRLLALLDTWRDRPAAEQGYGPGNVVNLLRLLRGDLRGLDLSRLSIRQAYLAEVEAQDASLADARLVETVLGEAFTFAGSVALSPDGALLAAGTSAGEVWLWRVVDRMPLLVLQAHTGPVWAVALSADGQMMASGGSDGMVRLWETSTGRQVTALEGHRGEVRGVALSPDGQRLASGGADGTVRVWDARTGRLLATLHGHTGEVRSVALCADGSLVASGGADGIVRVWEAPTGKPVATLEGHTGEVRGVAVSVEGQLVVSGGTDGTVQVWETRTGSRVTRLEGHIGVVWAVALSGDGRLVASGGTDRTVRVWDVGSGRRMAALQGHTGMVYGLALSGDGQLVASGATDGTVRLWQARTGQPIATLHGRGGAVRGVALSADGRLVACGGTDRTVRVWEAGTGRLVTTLRGHTAGVSGVALSADGGVAASGGEDGTVRLWDLDTARLLATLGGDSGVVWSVALSADGQVVAGGGTDQTVRAWETRTGRPVATLDGHTGVVRAVALSGDGRLVASGGMDRTVRVWEVGAARPLATLEGHTGMVWCVAVSADGRLLASGSDDGTLGLWESSTGRRLATLEGHTGGVSGVALSADGRLLASGGEDRTVRLWQVATGQLLATLDGHTGVVWGVALAADGHVAASGSFDATVRLWDTGRGASVRVLRAERRYERLDMTGLSGVTRAQRAALLALGAVEQHAPAGERD